MDTNVFWPDCTEPDCPMLEEGYMVGGRKPPAWSMGGLLYREQQLVEALQPFAALLHKNLEHMSDSGTVMVRIPVAHLREALKLITEKP